ncbi:MAG: PAS domain S-box protein [Deltaproteobacteria bacterium]|nr:PAS domain S-box protein [Deltaproteobacteria bacterium]
MVRDLMRELGAWKSAIAITAVSVSVSAAFYLILSEIMGDFAPEGLVKSVLIPCVIAPILSFLLLRVYVQLDLAEEEIRREKAFIEGALDNLVDAFIVLDTEGRFLRWNRTVKDVTGYTDNEMRSLRPCDFFLEDDFECVSRALERVVLEGHARTEALVLTKAGNRIHYEFTGGILREADGHPLGICVSGRDITERKQAENALRGSEERYRSVFENTGTATVIIEEDTTISMANTEFERLSGYTKEEIEGKKGWTDFVVREDTERMKEYHRNRRQGRGDPPAEYEFRFVDREGRVKTVLNKVSLLSGTGKSVAALLDISERIRIEEEKGRLEGLLRQTQKMEALGALAGGIAHDFNNILAAIIGHTEIAQLQIPEKSKAKKSLENVLRASERAKDLVRQILAFSRQQAQELKPVPLGSVVREGLKLLRASLPATIEMRHENEKEIGIVKADPTQIYQILMNLCTNAAHAMEENGGVLDISLEKAEIDAAFAANHAGMRPGPYLRMAVRDTGKGMVPETLERIFEPYFTTKDKGKGTGLGLSVVHGIVKAHGGAVMVESEPGKGTTVSVYFPRIGHRPPALEQDLTEPLPTCRERILFVDDEPELVNMTREMLQPLGYEVFSTTSSVEALRLFREQPDRFDLVITDLTMPHMTGDRLARRMLRIRPDIPIILCTGYSEILTEDKAREMGIQEFVMKPLIRNDLALNIRKVLDKTNRRGEI